MRRLTRPAFGTLLVFWGAPAAAAVFAAPSPVWFVTGALAFGGLEYAVHRWLFHGLDGRPLYDYAHGAHHRKPSDMSRIAVPVPHGLVVAAPLLAASVAAGVPSAWGGLVAGYLLYERVHFRCHEKKPPRGILRAYWRWAIRNHSRHHYANDRAYYGVTSPVFDWLCGTGGRGGS